MEAARQASPNVQLHAAAERARRLSALLGFVNTIKAYEGPSEIVGEDDPWWELARCKGEDTDTFHPDAGQHVTYPKSVCSTCPVMDACLEYIFKVETPGTRQGVWGGLSQEERTKVAAERETYGEEAAALLIKKLREDGFEMTRRVYKKRGFRGDEI